MSGSSVHNSVGVISLNIGTGYKDSLAASTAHRKLLIKWRTGKLSVLATKK